MAVVILLAFKLQFYVVNIAFSLKVEGRKPGRFFIAFLSLSMSLIVLVLNMLLRLVVRDLQYLDTAILQTPAPPFLHPL